MNDLDQFLKENNFESSKSIFDEGERKMAYIYSDEPMNFITNERILNIFKAVFTQKYIASLEYCCVDVVVKDQDYFSVFLYSKFKGNDKVFESCLLECYELESAIVQCIVNNYEYFSRELNYD